MRRTSLILVGLIALSGCDDGEQAETTPHCAQVEDERVTEAPMRLLTRYEWDNTVSDLTSIDTNLGRTTFPVENSLTGFENDARSHNVSDSSIRRYLEASESIAQQSAGAIQLTTVDELRVFLKRAFRRPATSDELFRFELLRTTATAEFDPGTATELLISAVLQSPQFLYRIEFDVPGETIQEIKGYEMATRLSYFLWGTMPDDTLLADAESGALDTEEGVVSAVRRMRQDPKTKTQTKQFYRQWLGLDLLANLEKDPDIYPGYTPELAADLKASIDAMVDAAHDGGDVRKLLTSERLMLTPALADVLGETIGDSPIKKFPGERAGILTHPALMSLLAYPGQTSPIHRALWVREKLLCQHVPPPPDDLVTMPPEIDATQTTRERFTTLSANALCQECHQFIDPLGFGFENYDGLGRYRTEEVGQAVDASGFITKASGSKVEGEFDGAVDLANQLADSEEVYACVANQWVTFVSGQSSASQSACSSYDIEQSFIESEGDFEELMISIATSKAFRFRKQQEPQ